MIKFKKVSRNDHKTVEIDWLSNIKPIYIDTGETDLQYDVLYSDSNDFIFLNTDVKDNAFNVIKTIIAKNGGKKRFVESKKRELDEINKSLPSGIKCISCFVCDFFKISCMDTMITFEVKIERNLLPQTVETVAAYKKAMEVFKGWDKADIKVEKILFNFAGDGYKIYSENINKPSLITPSQ